MEDSTTYILIVMVMAILAGFAAGVWGGIFAMWVWIDSIINKRNK